MVLPRFTSPFRCMRSRFAKHLSYPCGTQLSFQQLHSNGTAHAMQRGMTRVPERRPETLPALLAAATARTVVRQPPVTAVRVPYPEACVQRVYSALCCV